MLYKYSSVVVLFFFSLVSIYGQVDNYFTTSRSMDIDVASMVDVTKRNVKHSILLENPFTKEEWQIELVPSYILSDNYALYTLGADGVKTRVRTQAPFATKGYIKGRSESRVSLTFNTGYIGGFIYDGKTKYYIEPIDYYSKDKSKGAFIMYPVEAIKDKTPKTCGADHNHTHYHPHEYKQEKNAQKSAMMNCYEVEWAIASDYQMFQMEDNSVANVENHNITVANDVQTNYDDEFADEIQFSITEQLVISTEGGDPWSNTTDAGSLLADFRTWGGSNFGSHSIGSLWTGRNFDGSTIGIAYVGAVCSSFQYNCLQNFSDNAEEKRVMVAHEIGHNFSATHDNQGDPYIMAPSVSEATSWSDNTINQIQGYYNSISCLGTCVSSQNPPVAGFTYDVGSACVVADGSFTSTSTGNNLSYLWTIEGGTPSSSTDQNPSVQFFSAGTYTVTLEVSNTAGSDTHSETITILDSPNPFFNTSVSGFSVTISDFSTYTDTYMYDFGDGTTSTEEAPTHVYTQDGTYTITLTATNPCGSETFTQTVTIANLPQAGFTASTTSGCTPLEVTYTSSSVNATGHSWTFEGGTPSSSTEQNPTVTYNAAGVYDVSLTVTNASGSDTEQKSDYVTISEQHNSEFEILPSGNGVYQFSMIEPTTTGILWDFGDGNTSTDVNPTHTYASEGQYTVSLEVTNTCGTSTAEGSVNVLMSPDASITSILGGDCAPKDGAFSASTTFPSYQYSWTYSGGILDGVIDGPLFNMIYPDPGSYSVTLTVSNDLGSDTKTYAFELAGKPESGFTYTQNENTVSFSGGDSDHPFSWDFGDGATSMESSPSHTYEAEGSYLVTLTQSNPCGATVTTETVEVSAVPVASIQVVSVSQSCAPSVVNYTSAYTADSYNYSWSFPGGEPASSTEASPQVTYSAPGVYAATLTVSNTDGSDTQTMENAVTVLGPPASGVEVSANGATYAFQASTSEYNYSWNFGDGTTGAGSAPSHTYTSEGTYMVILTTEHPCGDFQDTVIVQYFNPIMTSIVADIVEVCPGDTVRYMPQESGVDRTYAWTFEGGSPMESSEQNPVVVYNSPGTYDVGLSVSNPLHALTLERVDLITVKESPTAAFSYDVDGFTVAFANMSTASETYSWNLGDGSTSSVANPTHTFEASGVYQVTLEASGTCGVSSTTVEVLVGVPPSADFEVGSNTGCVPYEVQFTNTSSDNTDTYLWAFSGGNPAMSSDKNPQVTYSEPGSYHVVLIAYNQVGSDTIVKEDVVIVVDTLKDVESSVDLGDTFTINCMAEATGANGYLWDFGDGTSSAEQNPTHTYEGYGAYTVGLQIRGVCDTVYREFVIQLDDTDVEDLGEYGILMYPNPVMDGVLNVEIDHAYQGTAELKIYDAIGRCLKTDRLSYSKLNHAVDIQSLTSGLYIVEVMIQGKRYMKKVVVSGGY